MGKEKPVSFVRIGIVYTLSNIIIKGMSFLTTPIFTRLMSQEEYGSFSNISSWANIISVSYTHLDVYKRQGTYWLPSLCWNHTAF